MAHKFTLMPTFVAQTAVLKFSISLFGYQKYKVQHFHFAFWQITGWPIDIVIQNKYIHLHINSLCQSRGHTFISFMKPGLSPISIATDRNWLQFRNILCLLVSVTELVKLDSFMPANPDTILFCAGKIL